MGDHWEYIKILLNVKRSYTLNPYCTDHLEMGGLNYLRVLIMVTEGYCNFSLGVFVKYILLLFFLGKYNVGT